MFTAAIVEDHPKTSETIGKFLSEYCEKKHVGVKSVVFRTADEFLARLSNAFDLVFMDIQMPGTDGMSAARKMRERGFDQILVFITSLAQYAVDGYDVDALDFMVKPVTQGQFEMKMEKVFRALSRRSPQSTVSITITTDRALVAIAPEDLLYVETANHDLVYHTVHGEYRTRASMSAAQKQLEGASFVRANVSYLVNLQYTAQIAGMDLVLKNGERLPISRARKKEVLKALTEYLAVMV